MEPKVRKEVQEFIRACEHLVEFVHQQEGLMSNDEAGAILYHAQDLERSVIPYCKKRSESSDASIIAGWSKS